MRFVIVTGMSGAGKSTALKILEDFGYYCVDNLPSALISDFTRLVAGAADQKNACSQSVDETAKSKGVYDKVALGIDARSDTNFDILRETLTSEFLQKFPCEILFLDATDAVLVKRYKETRRKHPLFEASVPNEERSLAECISLERKRLEFLRNKADYVFDTTHMLTREIREELRRVFIEDKEFQSINVVLTSFGFKYGIPQDADLVFDVRFLPNPYYVEKLKTLTGNDAEVYDYVMGFDVSKEFYQKLTDMISFLIPHYISEGKTQLVIAIGCTGGRHRSVTMVNALYQALKGGAYGLKKEHSVVGNK